MRDATVAATLLYESWACGVRVLAAAAAITVALSGFRRPSYSLYIINRLHSSEQENSYECHTQTLIAVGGHKGGLVPGVTGEGVGPGGRAQREE